MSTVPVQSRESASGTSPKFSSRWIVNSWVDWLLIIFTPLIAIPSVLLLMNAGVRSETISLVVTAFFATGHHLPGLIRAYGDTELFRRFRWRFLLAPPLVFLAYFPLYQYHFSLYRLMILSWATWHGLMQLYGFVRIYDSKAGSFSRMTAWWDWLVCLCGFVTPLFVSPQQFSMLLDYWYTSGGPDVSPSVVSSIRTFWLAFTAISLTGFLFNYLRQWQRGPKPSPVKLLMLFSGLGLWWYAILGIEEMIISIALFDICHDVQYLVIVWLFNCRRVSANQQLGGFMRFVFRRGMVAIYLALIFLYGGSALLGSSMLDGTMQRIFYGVLFTSTILHYYYDGFIWKVREPVNQVSLDLQKSGALSATRQRDVSGLVHFLKWSPVVACLSVLFLGDFLSPPLSTSQTDVLRQLYSQSLIGNPMLPKTEDEQSWLYQHFESLQKIAAAVPEDARLQVRVAMMMANFGQFDEALSRLQSIVREHPDFFEAWSTLGGVQLYLGQLDEAKASCEQALAKATRKDRRAEAYVRLGEIEAYRGDDAAAEKQFEHARATDASVGPQISDARRRIDAVRRSGKQEALTKPGQAP